MMKDLEKNSFDIENKDGLLKTEETNVSLTGQETFNGGEETFQSFEKGDDGLEDNLFTSSNKTNKKEEKKNTSQSSVNLSLGASLSIPAIAVTLVTSIVIIGGTTGLIPTTYSGHVSNFLVRSTELGFELNRDPEKDYALFLSNDDYFDSQVTYYTNQVIFSNLEPNTVYDLKCYETSVEPMKLVFSSNYKTKAYDAYYSYVTNKILSDDYLTFNVDYEGEDISFVTINVYGDENHNIYTYEGDPIESFTVNVAGQNNVTCQISINGEVTHYEQLIYENEIIPVESLSFNQSLLELQVGDNYQLEATVLPENATNKDVIYTSNNEKVASIKNDVLTAVNEGSAIITAQSLDGNKTASLKVVVTKDNPIISVESITLNQSEIALYVNDKYQLEASILPMNAKDKAVTWSSDNPNIASVNEKGLVTALSDGRAVITVTTNDGGFTASCVVNVSTKNVSVNGVSLDYDELTLSVGDTQALTATVLPLNATNQNVTWNSSNEDVATVDENGLVTAISSGDAIITVTTEDGSYQDYCVITVQ